MTFRRFFRDMRIHYKLLLGYSAVFLLILASAGAAVYYMVEQTVEQNIEERLSESTGAMLGLVKTAAEVSIKNHLRSKAEASREMVAGVYDQYLSGYMGLREAKWRAEQLLLSQNIGETGYIYCVNSDGVAVVHPRPSVENVDFSEFDFVRKQMALKEGYLEYDWKNPGEQKARPKALYMVYFEPFDWIISASSYREEFASLINVDDFREDFMARRPGGGYAFVMNSGGSFVLHPRMEGHNISETLGSKAKGFIEEIRRRKNGKLVYEWRNPGETEAREKLVIFDYIPEYDWIVASSTYLDEVYLPLKRVRNATITVALAAAALMLFITTLISRSITRPLAGLTERLSHGARGDFSVRAESGAGDEVGELGRYFNLFMQRLEDYSRDLEKEIGERKASEETLRRSEERYRQVVENANESIVVIRGDGHAFFNDRYKEMTEYGEEELYAGKASDLVHPEDREAVENLRQAQESGEPAPLCFIFRMMTRKGREVWVQASEVRIEWEGKGAILSFQADISIRKRVEETLDRQKAFFRQLFENSPQAIALLDTEGRFMDVNKAFENLFGYARQEVVSGESDIVPEDHGNEDRDIIARVLSGESSFLESERLHKKGFRLPVSILGYPFLYKGEPSGAFFVYNDISERKEYEQKLTHLALHDSLTGLPNRTLFTERLGLAMRRRLRRDDYVFAVVMIDLDRFKQVNDTQGHVAGDKLLVETGKRISSCLRSMDTVARLGGDEFAVIIEEYGRKSEVIRIVRRLLEEIESPALIGGSSVQVTASAGVVMDMDRYRTPEEILRDADISMYKAKEQGKNRFRVFTPSMHTEAVEAVALENDLKRAIREKELFLEFQPIQSLKDSRTVGFEALVRWRHPAKGLLGPDQFIPLAEESGQILEIGAWVLRKACSTMAGWRESIQATREMVIAVNLSGRQLEQADLVESIGDILRETGLPAEALRLEITETSLTVNSDRVLKIFNEIKNLGVQISIDDFGTGYSSLSYLQNFPVDTLKVDRSFIQGIANGHEDLEIVRAVVFLAHSLGMDVVAEGVEEIEQLTAVQGLDCEYVQGFYFSHPVSQAEIEKMLASMADTGSC